MTCLVQRTNRFTELQAFLQTTSQILRKLRKKCHEHCPSQRQPQALEWQRRSDTLLLTRSPLLSCWPTSTLPPQREWDGDRKTRAHHSTPKGSHLSLCKNKAQSDSVTQDHGVGDWPCRVGTRADSRFGARSAASAGAAGRLVPVVTSVPGPPRMRGTHRDSLGSLRRAPAKGTGRLRKTLPSSLFSLLL